MEVDAEGVPGGQHDPRHHAAVSSTARPLASRSTAAVDEDSDDWDPVVTPGVVLRPHVLQWKPSAADKDGDEVPAGQTQTLKADPLHDPGADDDDAKWVATKLMQPDGSNVRSTDAVLNCPGCFTPVCYQCQKHEEHARQWRAVEVYNCKVDRSAPLVMSKGDPTRYFAVRCDMCGADVGVQDPDDVFHLFHVLESVS
eukprot:TRINITY_DN112267_c0_g1_i1.p1 TRINITY_DN112267_c0_g1~~TRINITY_DN112267_c0_g1_i1.p1  ORF type:complete len:198 (-),score=37.55 TRINITY_DN112267_c0_g1_i1:12-605(-)